MVALMNCTRTIEKLKSEQMPVNTFFFQTLDPQLTIDAYEDPEITIFNVCVLELQTKDKRSFTKINHV